MDRVVLALVLAVVPAAMPRAGARDDFALLAVTAAAGGATTTAAVATAVAATGVPAALAAFFVRGLGVRGRCISDGHSPRRDRHHACRGRGDRLSWRRTHTAALRGSLAARRSPLWPLSAANGRLERLPRGCLAAVALALCVPAQGVEARR